MDIKQIIESYTAGFKNVNAVVISDVKAREFANLVLDNNAKMALAWNDYIASFTLPK